MNIFKIKKQVENYLVGIEERFETEKAKSAKEINDAIRERQSDNVDFDKAAVDVLLERAVELEAVAALVKGFLETLDVK